jgi:hypothetical protein
MPVETEAFTMPADHRLGLNDEETRPPASPQAVKPDPEDPIAPVDAGALRRALENGYLLAQGQVLRGERRAALEQQSEKDGDDLQYAHRGSLVRGVGAKPTA